MLPDGAQRASFGRKTSRATAERTRENVSGSRNRRELYRIIVAWQLRMQMNFNCQWCGHIWSTTAQLRSCIEQSFVYKAATLSQAVGTRLPILVSRLESDNLEYTYNSLLNPLMMRIEQRPAEVHCQLRRMDEYVKFIDLRTDYHSESEFVFGQLWANFWYGFLEKARRSNHVDTLDQSRKEWLKRLKGR